PKVAHRLVRWKNILVSLGIFQLCRRAPAFARKMMRKGAIASLPKNYEVDTHFNPNYEPWDQRLCLIPDDDLYRSIREGHASVATGEIDSLTEDGILLKSGQHLAADIIVSATGLQMLVFGAARLVVDGVPIHPGRTFVYKGTILSNVPNFAFCVGYTNASWTLRADLASIFLTRVLNHMERKGYRTCKPVCETPSMETRPLLNLTSGYVMRSAADLPKQAAKKPWVIRQNYLLDLLSMCLSRMEDGVLEFAVAAATASVGAPERAVTASAD